MAVFPRGFRGVGLASAGACAVLSVASCAPGKSGAGRAAHEPTGSRLNAPPVLLPGSRAAGASLFGTDVFGLATGLSITPDATPGTVRRVLDPKLERAPYVRAGGAAAMALSRDGRTLAVLTSGFNRVYDDAGDLVPEASTEHVFLYDVASDEPREVQVLAVPNAYGALAFAPQGDRLFVSGGPDDAVYVFRRGPSWTPEAPWPLAHLTPTGLGGLGLRQGPYAAGLALTASGERLVVANHENDSVTILDTRSGARLAEVSLAPGGGRAGGGFPWSVAVLGEDRAFVSAQRDREIVEVDLRAARVVARYPVGGHPNVVLLDARGKRLFVANGTTDSVSVVDTEARTVRATFPIAAPSEALPLLGALRGSNPNALALSPDERTLFVSNAGNNAVAVVQLDGTDLAKSKVTSLLPTGYYPTALAASPRGTALWVAHAKGPSGPNPAGPWTDPRLAARSPYARTGKNQFSLQLHESALLAMPLPTGATAARLTEQVLANNRFAPSAREVPAVFRALSGKVKHVVYIIGENRSYDQVLGDLATGDGDPRLVLWGEALTPNHHALARSFVTADRYFCSGGVSGDGWQWSTSGRTTDVAERTIPLEYAERGRHSYDWEGKNRGINVGTGDKESRKLSNPRTPDDDDLLPGRADVAAVDGPDEGGTGFLWDAALAAGISVRNYGFFCDESRYDLPRTDPAFLSPLLRFPFSTGTRVAFPTRASLLEHTDPYFRCYDPAFPDVYRVAEWARELREFVARGNMPALELVRLPRDHLGKFQASLDGTGTPDAQIADHDLAIGELVEALSRTPFWESTVVIALEDDAQNGADHVHAQRSLLLLAGGAVRRGVSLHEVYTTASVLRTIELLLGIPPLGQVDAFARPLTEAFTTDLDPTPYDAIVPGILRTTSLPLPAGRKVTTVTPPRGGDAKAWEQRMADIDFTEEDRLPARFNRLLESGLRPNAASSTRSSP